MPGLFFVLLGLHLAAVVLAYVPAVVVPFLRTVPGWTATAVERLSVPAIISMPITGAAMVVVAGINPATSFWLWFSILLYLATLVYLLARQRPRILRLVHGERSAELTRELRRAAVGVIAVIGVIGVMMMVKPGA